MAIDIGRDQSKKTGVKIYSSMFYGFCDGADSVSWGEAKFPEDSGETLVNLKTFIWSVIVKENKWIMKIVSNDDIKLLSRSFLHLVKAISV